MRKYLLWGGGGGGGGGVITFEETYWCCVVDKAEICNEGISGFVFLFRVSDACAMGM